MSDRAHAEEMLEAARRDVRALRSMTDPAAFADEIFGFHAQQAVEKAMKAWLAFRGQRYPTTHDLQTLIDRLDAIGISTEGFDEFVDLNAFAVQYRYESLYDDEEPLDRVALADRVEWLIGQVATAFSK